MPRSILRVVMRAFILIAMAAPGPALAQFGVPAPNTPAIPCPAFTGFPLALNLGSISLFGNDGITNRCAFQTTQSALNALSTQAAGNAAAVASEASRATAAEALLAPLASPTFTGTMTTPKLTLSGSGSTGDVSGMSVLGSGEAAMRALANRLLDIPVSVDSFRGGACASAPDDTCATQAAINAAAAQKREVLLSGGTLTVGSLTFPSNVTIRGRGEGVSTLKLKNGANSTLLASVGAYSLFGTNSQGGIFDFAIADLTLDGNRAANTGGECLAIYGARFRLRNLTLKNCPGAGLKTAWGQFGDFPMEAAYNNVTIDTTGGHGADLQGPHDSIIDNLIIIDGGQSANTTYSQLLLSGNMNGRFSNVHTWHRSTATNRTIYGLNDQVGGSDFSSSHFEGSQTAPVYLAGTATQLNASNTYYSPWATGSASIILAGNNNRVQGTILGSLYMSGQPARTGLYAAPTASGNVVDLVVLGSSSAAVDVSAGDGGYNSYMIRGSQSGGNGFIGAFADTSSVNLQMFGAASNGRLVKDAGIPPPSSSSSPCTYGQRAFDTQFEYRCTAANTWKRAAISTW